jgi:hypothetical protein
VHDRIRAEPSPALFMLQAICLIEFSHAAADDEVGVGRPRSPAPERGTRRVLITFSAF